MSTETTAQSGQKLATRLANRAVAYATCVLDPEAPEPDDSDGLLLACRDWLRTHGDPMPPDPQIDAIARTLTTAARLIEAAMAYLAQRDDA